MALQNGKSNTVDQSDCPFSPGEVVAESGIYEICHADEGRTSVLLVRNMFFPVCKRCQEAVRYKLIQAAPHISEDPDFVEDLNETDNPLLNAPTPTTTSPQQLGTAYGFRFWQDVVQTWGSGSGGGNL